MATSVLDKKELAGLVDHTLLRPEATAADVDALIADAIELCTWSVCVSPTFVAHAKKQAQGKVKICTVVGFPSGKVKSEIKAAEAALAVKEGADEIDMVIDVGKAKEGDFSAVQNDIEAVRNAIPGTLLKVIIESAALSDQEIVATSQAAKAAKADFVKTSTGFHPSGGATPHAVALMAQTVGKDLGVKASGGVRTLADAQAVIEKGATRLGLSGTAAVLAGFDEVGDKAPGKPQTLHTATGY
ncbi:MAG: deoxyribose-phosphate aldolase [Cellulomonadaceae bacterium]|nr:deoxyribose-phosphate aldolase [Cellulomonadaceae bacterium]